MYFSNIFRSPGNEEHCFAPRQREIKANIDDDDVAVLYSTMVYGVWYWCMRAGMTRIGV
jgi:hypothetical protein